jgi:uncharacterized membrane protein
MPNREVRLLATVAAALLVAAAIAGLLFNASSAHPVTTVGTLLLTTGLAAVAWRTRLRFRERRADRAAGIKWRRWLDDTLSDESLAWVMRVWSRK